MMEYAAAMVLAAGRGERMRPLSEVLPKPALPLVGGPVVASALGLAARAGARRIVVNTWHLAKLMENAVAAAAEPGVEVALSREESLMGTAGGLALARDRGLLGSRGPVLVINGDGISELDISHLFEHHTTRHDAVTLGLLPHPDPTRWSRVLVDTRGKVTAIRPPGEAGSEERCSVYPGVMAVSREALDALPPTPGETPDRLWFPALASGKLGGAVISGIWREVGTPADYLAVITEQLAGESLIDPTAFVAPTAVIDASFIGRNARIGDRAVVRGSVAAEGAVVEFDAFVNRTVLLGPVRVSAATAVENEFLVGRP